MFMLLNRGVKFDEKFLVNTGLDGFLRVPLTNESISVPEELRDSLADLLTSFKGVGKSN